MSGRVQIRAAGPSPSTTSSLGYIGNSRTGGGSGGILVPRVDSLINLLEGVSREYLSFGGTVQGQSRILGGGRESLDQGWRVNVRRICMLARLREGWDFPDSQPLNSDAQVHYLEWLSHVSQDRMSDAEPMLTDDGNIRLEWRRNGYAYVAEIGSNSLYLASLAPNSSNDTAKEFDEYDPEALNLFFARGAIRS